VRFLSLLITLTDFLVTGPCISEPVPYDCIPVKAHNEAMNQTMKKQAMRFTPIQPNIPFEGN